MWFPALALVLLAVQEPQKPEPQKQEPEPAQPAEPAFTSLVPS